MSNGKRSAGRIQNNSPHWFGRLICKSDQVSCQFIYLPSRLNFCSAIVSVMVGFAFLFPSAWLGCSMQVNAQGPPLCLHKPVIHSTWKIRHISTLTK